VFLQGTKLHLKVFLFDCVTIFVFNRSLWCIHIVMLTEAES